MSKRVGRNTWIGIPLWLYALPLLLVCGLIGLMIQHPWKALMVVGILALIAVVLVPVGIWISRTVDRTQERWDQSRGGQ